MQHKKKRCDDHYLTAINRAEKELKKKAEGKVTFIRSKLKVK